MRNSRRLPDEFENGMDKHLNSSQRYNMEVVKQILWLFIPTGAICNPVIQMISNTTNIKSEKLEFINVFCYFLSGAISIKNCHCLFSQNLLKIVQKCGGQYSDWSGFIFKDMAFTSLQRLSQVFNHDIFIVFIIYK